MLRFGRPRGWALVLGAAFLFAFITASPAAVHAATSAVTLTVNVSDLGAPAFTYTISGCAASPTSGTTGLAVALSVTEGCAFTITVPADGSTQRDRLFSGTLYLTSLSETCSAATCTYTLASHVQEKLAVSTSCNGATTSPSSPTSDSWFNYGTGVRVTCNGVWGRSGSTGLRAISWNWDSGTNTAVATSSTFTTSPQTMDGGHTLNVATTTQYLLTLDTGATAAKYTVTSPTIIGDYYWYDTGTSVSYTGNGVFGRSLGTGTRSVSWSVDSGGATALSTTATFNVPLTMSSAHTVHVTSVQQFQVTLDSATTAQLKSITSPTIAGDNYWYDSSGKVTLVLNGIGTRAGGVGTRLASYSVNGATPTAVATTGTVTVLNGVSLTGGDSVTGSVVTQYLLSVDSGATGAMKSITPPLISGDAGWYDSGTAVTYVGSGVFSRSGGAGSRVTGWSLDSGTSTSVKTTGNFTIPVTMGAAHTVHTTTGYQFQVAFSGPHMVSSATPPTIPGDYYWYDSGSVVSVSLQGVFDRAGGAGVRMTAVALNGGAFAPVSTLGSVNVLNSITLASPQTISTKTVEQYEVTLNPAAEGALVYATPPTIQGDAMWYDSGTAVSVTARGVWDRNATAGYRLVSFSIGSEPATAVNSSGTVLLLGMSGINAPAAISVNDGLQYYITVNGGYGVSYSKGPPISGDTGWYDERTTLAVSSSGFSNVNSSVRNRVASWAIDGGQATLVPASKTVTTDTFTMNGPHTVAFGSVTQFLVRIEVRSADGASVLSPQSISVEVNGGAAMSVTGPLWVDRGSSLVVSGVTWEGSQVGPTNSAGETIGSPSTVTVDAKVYRATVMVKDMFGLPVEGATVDVTLANGTKVTGVTDSSGAFALNLIPLGTYDGSVSNYGTSTHISADASVASEAVAGVSLSLSAVVIIAAIIVIVVAAVFIVRRWRRGPGRQ